MEIRQNSWEIAQARGRLSAEGFYSTSTFYLRRPRSSPWTTKESEGQGHVLLLNIPDLCYHHADKTLKVAQKETLVSLPTELVEQIAEYLDKQDIVSFRLTSYELAGKSTSAFRSILCNDMYRGEPKIALPSEHPECASHVHSVTIGLWKERRNSEATN